MLHLPMLSDMSTIIPATPAVWCDPGVRIGLEQVRADVWCDPGARIFGQDVWCDPGVRLEAVNAPAPQALAARVEEALDIWAFAPAEEDEESLPELELPRFVPQQAHILLPAIPDRISPVERRRQRVASLADLFGWDEEDARELLDEVLADGVSEGHLARLVEEHDHLNAERLHVAWEARVRWFEDGPRHHARWDVKLTWDSAALLVLRMEASDVDELLVLLDDAYREWANAGGWDELGAFHDALTGWLMEAEPYDILRHNFPW